MAIVVLSFASTTIHWLWLLAFLSLFMLQSCLADNQLKLHRLSSRKLCPSCNTRLELYPFFGDSQAAQESISDQTGHTVWIPIRVSVSAAAVMMLLGSFLWHMSRGNALFEENDQEADIRGSRESRTGNDRTDNTSEGENQVECPDSSLCRLDITCTMTIRMILPKVKTRCNIQTSRCVSGENKMDNQVDTQDVPSFSLNVIRKATEYFSGKNLIGRGGFGNVYKGVLPDGQEIAVKRLSTNSGQGVKQLNKEVVSLAKLQHINLVRLLGICSEGEEKIIIYEFVTNKSLDYFLYDPEKQRELNWSRRYKIIRGIARGILCLHEYSRFRIIHRDLKTSNILLDGNMNPKISDFGMAKIIGVDQTQGYTNRIVGTYGYMSPEYYLRGQFSIKSDVYSFGILIIEIITGKKNSSFHQTVGAGDLLSYAWKHWIDGTPMELLDSNLTDSYSRNEVMRCIHLGLLCVQEDPAARPTMATVVLMLNSYSVTLPLPQQPAYCEHITKGTDSDKSMLCSVDDASITELHPR